MPTTAATQAIQEDLVIGPSLVPILATLRKLASTSLPILFLGERGVGKSEIARLVHNRSARTSRPFVPINCAAIPNELIESELFGHEKGAFTTATDPKPGLFEVAGDGTVFLDEIGSLALSAQAKLLFALEGKPFRRVGGTHEVVFRARVIAATNHDLEKDVENGKFLSDLYDRIQEFPIEILPLRARKPEIVPLARFFFERSELNDGSVTLGEDEEGMEKLLKYLWPGNVRELRQRVNRALLYCEDSTLTLSAIMRGCSFSETPTIEEPRSNGGMFGRFDPECPPSFELVEREYLTWLRSAHRNNLSKMARVSGLTRNAVRYRLERLELVL